MQKGSLTLLQMDQLQHLQTQPSLSCPAAITLTGLGTNTFSQPKLVSFLTFQGIFFHWKRGGEVWIKREKGLLGLRNTCQWFSPNPQRTQRLHYQAFQPELQFLLSCSPIKGLHIFIQGTSEECTPFKNYTAAPRSSQAEPSSESSGRRGLSLVQVRARMCFRAEIPEIPKGRKTPCKYSIFSKLFWEDKIDSITSVSDKEEV